MHNRELILKALRCLRADAEMDIEIHHDDRPYATETARRIHQSIRQQAVNELAQVNAEIARWCEAGPQATKVEELGDLERKVYEAITRDPDLNLAVRFHNAFESSSAEADEGISARELFRLHIDGMTGTMELDDVSTAQDLASWYEDGLAEEDNEDTIEDILDRIKLQHAENVKDWRETHP